ncbi:MAG: nucleotidyltransferase, partial [Candidatus Kapabacteria bacterium]|nr:nucleotidyltransferase [Candidatus Kapabacteria bacterium]
KMIEDKIQVSDNITSFLIECLLWNVPNKTFNDYDTWTERLKQSIIFLYNNTKEDKDCKEWGEVSELLYLFHSGRKWSREDVNAFLLQAWKYLEF